MSFFTTTSGVFYKTKATRKLRARLLLLATEQGPEGNTDDLDDLETDARQVTSRVAGTTETGDEDFIVFIDELEATVVGDESGDLLAVLDELDTNALTNSRVRLLRFDTAVDGRDKKTGKENKCQILEVLSETERITSTNDRKKKEQKTNIFSTAIPLTWEAPWKGLYL